MNLFNQITSIGDRAERMADHLLSQTDDHRLHRIGVVSRDLANTVAQAMAAFTPEADSQLWSPKRR